VLVPFRETFSGIGLAAPGLPADPGPDRVPDQVVGSPGVMVGVPARRAYL
jgi:hypothetical protein